MIERDPFYRLGQRIGRAVFMQRLARKIGESIATLMFLVLPRKTLIKIASRYGWINQREREELEKRTPEEIRRLENRKGV